MAILDKKVTNYDLWQFCLYFSRQFGAVHDAVRFRAELDLRFYHSDHTDLYERCLQRNLFREEGGNIIFKVDGRNKG